ncbi:hypothetical protein MLD38_028339 [Melastoma candidum]|uniref:Uncharacterized protein n=1 Tax=Melastoma candidum TaxID=119954 RepID=A0ACB9N0J7_9MYRT|nr:hypothetical protein MLD38_028339 [Melastoma candidum]
MAASASVRVIGKNSSCLSHGSRIERPGGRNIRVKVTCSAASVTDPYRTLRIDHGASESEVKKAFRRLALQYHPDVCRGSNCGVQFHMINEAYDMVMSQFRGGGPVPGQHGIQQGMYEEGVDDEGSTVVDDQDWELWEEWMGWEGAGIRDYSSHINPYI